VTQNALTKEKQFQIACVSWESCGTYMGSPFFLVLRNCVALEISLNTLENVEGSHPKMCKALKCFFFVWVCCSFKSLQVFPVRYLNIRLVVAVVYLSQNTGSSKCQYTYRHRWEAGHANIPSSCCRDL